MDSIRQYPILSMAHRAGFQHPGSAYPDAHAFSTLLTSCPRHAINRTRMCRLVHVRRHSPVHALDSIILQAQVQTPSGG